MKRKNLQPKNTLYIKVLVQTWQKKPKLYRQVKPERIEGHQTSLTTNDKVTSLGGKERQNSIYNALKYDNNSDIILVQDGVRPFLKEKYIEECCRVVAEERLGAVVGVQVKDTIKVINENFEVVSTPKRADLIAVHTPQAFEGKLLKEAYEIAERENFLGTDDSSLVERIGGKVKIVLGDYDNIKITTQEDLKFL